MSSVSCQEKGEALPGGRSPRGVLHLVYPSGFCSGVRRAIDICHRLLAKYPGRPLYVLRDLVHNHQVSRQLREEGVVFVEEVGQVPPGERLVLGAHGATRETLALCRQRGLVAHDATCPVICHRQTQLRRLPPDATVCLLGEAGHPEIQALRDCLRERTCHLVANAREAAALPPLPPGTYYFCQTSRGRDEVAEVRRILQEKTPRLHDQAHICWNQRARQQDLIELAPQCDRVYILGSSHSANGRRLLQLAQTHCPGPCRMVEEGDELSPEELSGVVSLGLASATSTPDSLVEEWVERFRRLGFVQPGEGASCPDSGPGGLPPPEK
ncbi:MAG: 4-hydroxy-3-methylbut-2-enyl diphosphate reductase [Oligosphaeraceae bacterium]